MWFLLVMGLTRCSSATGCVPGTVGDLLTGPGDLQVVHKYRNVIAPILSRHGAGKRMRTVC
jgi:hypothetical protein